VTFRTLEREKEKAFSTKREKPLETETSGGGGKTSTKTEKSGKIKSKGIDFNLQLFAHQDFEKNVLAKVKDGIEPYKSHYKEALFYYKKYLEEGIKAPDGELIKISYERFHHFLDEQGILAKRPELVAEIIRNAQMKYVQKNRRFIYYSYKPYGYIVFKDGESYSCKFYGKDGIKSIEDDIGRKIKRGGKLVWEKK